MLQQPDRFFQELSSALAGPLPGWEAQIGMASKYGKASRVQVPNNPREGGVLALLYPKESDLHMCFMERSRDGGVHSGQVSFPGGKREVYDRDLAATALREAEEELGIPAHQVELLGQFSQLYIPASNFMVSPFVGSLGFRPDFDLDEREVANLIEVPLQRLLEEESQEIEIKIREDFSVEAPAWLINDQIIWGATAMMLNELLVIIRSLKK
ncbi:MAG: CoA pyrophosphatase [Bacteroidia bacterium]|nr:CoA pyrophosphatase [Bacteroidia bacterium]